MPIVFSLQEEVSNFKHLLDLLARIIQLLRANRVTKTEGKDETESKSTKRIVQK